METLELARDVLDKQILDADGERMGRVDGMLLDLSGDGPPRVVALSLGFVVLAARLHPRLVGPLRRLRRWSVRRTARYRIPWERVEKITPQHVHVAVHSAETPADAWERWLLAHVVEHLPGGGAPDDERRKGKPEVISP